MVKGGKVVKREREGRNRGNRRIKKHRFFCSGSPKEVNHLKEGQVSDLGPLLKKKKNWKRENRELPL